MGVSGGVNVMAGRRPADTRGQARLPTSSSPDPADRPRTTESRVNRKDHSEPSSSPTKDDIEQETETSQKRLKPDTGSKQKLAHS